MNSLDTKIDPLMEGTSAAAELTNMEATSDTDSHMEMVEITLDITDDSMQVNRTSAAAEHTETWEGTQWPKNSIFRAPAHIRSGRESNFQPKLVSIGPYYHGQENLKRMEDLKLRCITELCQKQAFRVRNRRNRSIYNVSVDPSTQGGRGIDDVPLEKFMDSGKIARAYYKQEFNHSDVEFVRMLVIDSCFIIRTIFSLSQEVQESMAFLDVHIKDVRSDLLLLENQIPLFFINKVYEWLFPSWGHQEAPSFETVLEPFISFDVTWKINYGDIPAAHLLDLYWRCSLSHGAYGGLYGKEHPSWEEIIERSTPTHRTWEEMSGYSIDDPMVMANATELHKMAGIEFEKFKVKGNLEVVFSNGIMRMPRLKIDTRQTILLVNVIAFENCIIPSMRTFSCYMKLMDALIDTEKDVKLLQKCGVIYNTLSSHDKAATFFNDIGNICFTDNYTNPFSGLYADVLNYYNSSWRRRSVNLRKNYFSSPWAGISVIAGVTLLILSALQTFYTIYGYYNPKN